MARTASLSKAALSSLVLFGVALIGVSTAAPAEASFSKAKYHSKVGVCGSKYGPRKYGKTRYDKAFLHVWNKTCWSCPAGYKRTADPNVKGKNACRKAGKTSYKRAKKHKKVKFLGKCPKGQFVHTLNQTCYSCPKHYRRSANPHVSGAKACIKKTRAKLAAGKYRGKAPKGLLCAKGTFYDPRKGGECWSCPASHAHRTINPVTNPKACSSNISGVFAADKGAMCRKVIGAARDGEAAYRRLIGPIENVASTVTKPVNDAINKVTRNIKTPTAVDKQIRDVAQKMQKYRPAVERVMQIAKNVGKNPRAVKKIFLNPGLICGGDNRKIDNALIAAGLGPSQLKKRGGLLDNLIIGTAHAKQKSRFFQVYSLSFVGGPVAQPINAISWSYVTDYRGTARWFLSPGRAFGTGPTFDSVVPFDLNFATYFFLKSKSSDFDGLGSLGGEISFPLTGLGKKLVSKLPNNLRNRMPANCSRFICPKNFLFSFDPVPPFAVPGFGFEWNLAELEILTPPKPEGPDKIAGSIDFSFPYGR